MGFLGSYIIKRIIPQVETLTIVTKNFRQKTTFSLLNINSNKINIVKGNIEDFNFIESLFKKHRNVGKGTNHSEKIISYRWKRNGRICY